MRSVRSVPTMEVSPEHPDQEDDVRPFTPRKRTTTARTTRTSREQTVREVLAGLDDAHRRELEIMLEDAAR